MPELGHEHGSTVGDDGIRKHVKAEDSIEEEPCETGSIDSLIAWDEVGCASETVAHHPNRVVAVRCRKFYAVVHRD